ncbi:MAG TPA: DUF4920 domain-containing protein [Cytophagales bacterium]|nr:DUF4920 domain-containing protein [Cytophagales bacterium]HAA19951.1 DUF4920 domain-containing protein [Cytophagales bacterium]HAP62622.1 DUF4920 domain-containing protein [Cytophagales bacterium]
MKFQILLGAALVAIFSSCQPTQDQQSQEENSVPAGFVSYGEGLDLESPHKIGELSSLLEGKDSVVVKVEGEIEQTCAMKGCWMTVKNELGEAMRVTFKDYGFFVPKEGQEGKRTIFEGVVRKAVVSVEEQRHYAEDGGQSAEQIAAITEPQEVYSFVASGVLIESEEVQN